MKKSIFIGAMFILIFSCTEWEGEIETYVYGNDFESENFTGLSRVFISNFNGTKVLGNYNNSGFSLELENLPEHEYIRIFFDLYIHDSWEGNSNNETLDELDHDAWILALDSATKKKAHNKLYFETTFSNMLCIPGYCFNQSYPNEFPYHNEARTGAVMENLPGLCLFSDTPIGSSHYKIDKIFPHSEAKAVFSIFDRLKQRNSASPICDESWSIDNLAVTVFKRLK